MPGSVGEMQRGIPSLISAARVTEWSTFVNYSKNYTLQHSSKSATMEPHPIITTAASFPPLLPSFTSVFSLLFLLLLFSFSLFLLHIVIFN